MDHGDPVLERFAGRAEVNRATSELHRAAVGWVDPGDDLHERRLAGAVLAHDRVDRAGLHA